MSTPSIDLSKMEYYKEQEAQRTLIARIVLLTIIFGMLASNMWLTQRNYEALLINVDQTRLAQVRLHDVTAARLAAMELHIADLQATVDHFAAKQAVLDEVEVASAQ